VLAPNIFLMTLIRVSIIQGVTPEPPKSLFLPFPFPLPLPLPLPLPPMLGLEIGGGGATENMVVPAVVDVEAAAFAEGALHPRAWSRTRRLVLGPSSGPARSP
jgi:hypothetical protein